MDDWTATRLLQQLIRFDTTSPPGNEAACVHFIRDRLAAVGIESRLYAEDPARPNLIARIAGRGRRAPLLVYGHVDVVPADERRWSKPPFAGLLEDGWVWGRGALDMKGGVAMFVSAVVRVIREAVDLPGDVILAIVSDEEQGSEFGARFLVEQHPELFRGVRYALGEFGGFSYEIDGARFYPIQVAERHISRIRAIFHGPGGHASTIVRGGAAARLGEFLRALDRNRFPLHISPAAMMMIEGMAAGLPWPKRTVLKLLLRPMLTDTILPLLGAHRDIFEPLLRSTVNVNIVSGGVPTAVIPEEIELGLVGHVVPGQTTGDLLHELRRLAGDGATVELVRASDGPPEPEMGGFDSLASVLKELDPLGIPVPLLLQSATDGHHFSRLGIQTYGFTPMRLPPEFSFVNTIHAENERVPATAIEFGAEAVFRALQSFTSKNE